MEHAAERRRVSRRRFLELGGALGAAGVLGPRAAAAHGRPSPGGARIAIVGAGIAGLTCAYRLEQAGLRAQLFDSWNRVGGRMFTTRGRFAGGQHAELGGEFIDTGHDALRALVEELGLRLDPILEEPGNDITQDTWFFGGRAVSDGEVVEAFRAVAPRLAADAASEEDEAEFTRLDELGLEGERAGNLHFCGEHTSVDFQGYMNGGAETGERVAAELTARGRRRAAGA
ncbi:MAG: FAD-dependent oxidoreductase [Deltaproteobacteria bacterium]